MSKATLHFGDQQIEVLDVELPICKPVPAPLNWCGSTSFSFKINPGKGKVGRKFRQLLFRLTMSVSAWDMVKFYHSIKSHQARKRLINKRRHA